jgi:hypothetical protein
MKTDGFLKHLLIAAGLSVLLYAVLFFWIEGRRKAQRPWEVTFQSAAGQAPRLSVRQPDLGISNVVIEFPGRDPGTNLDVVGRFDVPREFPHPLPLGACVFADLTFLPGTVAMDVLGHRVELLPARMLVDSNSVPWGGPTNIVLPPVP